MSKEPQRGLELEDFLSAAEAAEILGVHPVAVGQMLKAGRLPGRKVARNWIIPKDAVLEFAKTYIKGPGRRSDANAEGKP